MRDISREELRAASPGQLNLICEELREEIFRTVSVCGGHLSSNLGAVELTVALHRTFSFPKDKLIFDVGHQCYAHKLLSGRADAFHTLRRRGGISGFPKRSESDYDCYDTGHAGTAISAALGIAKARDLRGEDFRVIALVGDGSFNNGLVYEALNSLPVLNTKILILLNDNGMSISPTVGGTHEALEGMKAGNFHGMPLFETFGLQYLGVCNGNDLDELLPALEQAKTLLEKGSVLLHVTTKKGQGYSFCENAPMQTHGVSFSRGSGKTEYSAVLGETLCALAEEDSSIAAVTAAMTDSLGLRTFFNRFPERAFDVGICEEHASVLAASLAAGGMKPYYAIYSTFLERAFDEVIHDICAQDLPVTLCIDRAGITGEDGETHQGVFDLSYLSPIPNLTIAIPKDVGQFRAMLKMSASYRHPLAIRYPREGTEGEFFAPEIGKFEVLHSTLSDIVLLAVGERCLSIAQTVLLKAQKQGIDITLVNACYAKPLDTAFLLSCEARLFVTLEDNVLIGGFGDSVSRVLRGSGKRVLSFGYPDTFIPHGNAEGLMREFGLDPDFILEGILHARG